MNADQIRELRGMLDALSAAEEVKAAFLKEYGKQALGIEAYRINDFNHAINNARHELYRKIEPHASALLDSAERLAALEEQVREAAAIIEYVDHRAMFGDAVSRTEHTITPEEVAKLCKIIWAAYKSLNPSTVTEDSDANI